MRSTASEVWSNEGELSAQIRWTTYGVPHIRAGNLESLAFGFGYAQAADNLCVLAEAFINMNAQRSRYFGPDGKVPGDGENVFKDFLALALRHRALADERWPGMPEQSRALITGYAFGYNKYLSEARHDSAAATHECLRSEWVRAIAPQDVLAYLFSLASLAGADQYSSEIWAAAQAETLSAGLSGQTASPMKTAERSPGSNGWALGRDLTRNGRGMLLANPHFPHQGNMRFWESHLTVPGVIDVAGASILGVPGVINIGFNEHIAWSHTYSTAQHTVIYRLDLLGDRHSYVFDGRRRQLKARTYSILVRHEGRLEKVDRTFYYSHLGPILQSEVLPWNEHHAYALADLNEANADILEHWLAINRADSFATLRRAFQRYNGMLFNNTVAADRLGNVYYIDDSAVPDLNEAAANLVQSDETLLALAEKTGSVVIPASGRNVIVGGPIPFSRAPRLQRTDFVQNSNDSHWLTNPAALLTGFSPLYGPEEVEQSFRTRMGLTMLQELRNSGRRVATADVEAALFSHRSYLPELIADDVRDLCRRRESLIQDKKLSQELGRVCNVLERSDGRHAPLSVGAPIWRELAAEMDVERSFRVPFDVNDPVNTPRKLRIDSAAAQTLLRAAANLRRTGWPLVATLSEMQFVTVEDNASTSRLSWPGGDDATGGFNTFSGTPHDVTEPSEQAPEEPLPVSGLRREGYSIDFGSSWMMVVEFDAQGPRARGLMVYSQSTAPGSPHYSDQTRRYSAGGGLRPMPFRDHEIAVASLRERTLHLRIDARCREQPGSCATGVLP